MSLPAMSCVGRRFSRRALSAGMLCIALIGCGRPDDGVIEARKTAEEAAARVSELEATVEKLGGDLEAAQQGLASAAEDRRALAARLKRAVTGMRASLGRVRKGVGEVRASSSAASSSAASAIAELGELAHSIAVLKNRYDYHLSTHHGDS